jgi:hypothetical protein
MSEPPVHTTVDDIHAHAHKTGHRWVDMAIAISAITISVISLFVAIEHGKTEEKLVAANSWPFVIFQSSENGLVSGSRILDLRLQNSGVGPARVQYVKVMLDGRPVHDHSELLARCCGVAPTSLEQQVRLGLVSQNEAIGVLPARDGVDLLAWRERPGAEAVWAELNTTRHRLRFKACYCSVLDECWVSDLTPTARPQRVGQCPTDSDGYSG